MIITTATTPADVTKRAPLIPQPTRRILWAAVAFTLGGIVGAGATVALDESPSGRTDVGGPRTGALAPPSADPRISPDAIDRVSTHWDPAAEDADCTRLPTSADAVERCLTADR